MERWMLCLLVVGVALLASLTSVRGLGCPCVDGQAFPPYTGPGRFNVPAAKPREDAMQLAISNFIALKLRGVNSAVTFQQPNGLRDYAYEHSKIMALNEDIHFTNWPAACMANPGGSCDWQWYKDNREYYIKQAHSLDFSDVGFPLQSATVGGRGYCVLRVEEFYGKSTSYSPSRIVDDIANQAGMGESNPLFPNFGVVNTEGPHLYGVGVYTDTTSVVRTYWLTIIRVTLTTAAPCECANTPCTP